MRCRQCYSPTASKDSCSVCKADPLLARPQAADITLLEAALASSVRALVSAEAPLSLQTGALPRVHHLRCIVQALGGNDPVDAEALAPLLAKMPSLGALNQVCLTVRASEAADHSHLLESLVTHLLADGQGDASSSEGGDVAAPAQGQPPHEGLPTPSQDLSTSAAPAGESSPAPQVALVWEGYGVLSFRLVVRGAERRMELRLAPPEPASPLQHESTSEPPASDDGWKLMAHSSESGSWSVEPGLPRVPPPDLDAWSGEVMCESIAFFLLWLGFAPPSEPFVHPATLGGVGKEVWHSLQEQLAALRDPLTPPGTLVRFKTSLFRRERSFFRSLDVAAWTATLLSDSRDAIDEGAREIVGITLQQVQEDVSKDLQACLRRGGLEGLGSGGEQLEQSLARVQGDITTLLQAQARSEEKSLVMLRQQIDNLVSQSGSLMWLLRRPVGWEEAIEAANYAVEQVRDTSMLRHLSTSATAVGEVLASLYRTLLEQSCAREARLRELREGCDRNLRFLSGFRPGIMRELEESTELVRSQLSAEQLEQFAAWAEQIPTQPSAHGESEARVLRSASAVLRNLLSRRPQLAPAPRP